MQSRQHTQWEKLGATDPYWAVLTDNTKRHGKWEPDAFFHTGVVEIDHLFKMLGALDIIPASGVALDFGCGVGRLSRALAARFDKVIAIDVSSSMLDEARRVNATLSNIEFIHNVAENLSVIEDNQVDFIYSNIVLQHIPRMLQQGYISEFCRILKPRGTLVFQTPSSSRLTNRSGWMHLLLGNRLLNILRKLKYGEDGVMEIHTFHQQDVLKVLDRHNMTLKKAERYDSAGPAYKSYRYFAVKN